MNQDIWVDFRQIKEQASIEQVLKHYGVALHHVGDELRGQCPLPTHTSQSSQDSFSVNRARNVWCCQSSSCMNGRDGKVGGTVLDLVAIMEHCSTRDAALRLRHWFGITPSSSAVPRTTVNEEPIENRPLGFTLRDIDPSHPYLRQRQISLATAQAFGIGFYPGPGLLHGRVVIPIRNVRHELVAYAGRAVNGEEPKYLLPPGFRKSQLLFNLDRARNAGLRTVIVVEGFFDTVAAHQSGHRNVVGLMGSSLSETQAGLLQKHFDQAVLMLDGDEAGQRATAVIANRLAPKMGVHVVTLQPGQQPDQLASKEITQLVGGYSRQSRGFER